MRGASAACSAERHAIDRNGRDQERPGEHAGELGGQRRQPQPVAQDRERQQPEQGAAERAAAAEHRRPAQHHGGDRVELVAGAGIGARLAQVRDVDDTGATLETTADST